MKKNTIIKNIPNYIKKCSVILENNKTEVLIEMYEHSSKEDVNNAAKWFFNSLKAGEFKSFIANDCFKFHFIVPNTN